MHTCKSLCAYGRPWWPCWLVRSSRCWPMAMWMEPHPCAVWALEKYTVLFPTSMIEPHPCAVWTLEKYSYQPAWLSPTPVQFEPSAWEKPHPFAVWAWRNTLTNQHDWAPPLCSLSPLTNQREWVSPLCSWNLQEMLFTNQWQCWPSPSSHVVVVSVTLALSRPRETLVSWERGQCYIWFSWSTFVWSV